MHAPYGMELVENCQRCTFRTQGFFCDLPPAVVKAFEAIKHTTAYPEGAVLFVESESPRGIFVLCKGRVKLSVTSSEGRTMILRIVHPGEVLGLNAVVSGDAYQATAETLEPCQVNFVKRDDFLRFVHDNREACVHAAQQLSKSYQAACNQIRSLGLSQSVPERLARFLLEWAAKGHEAKQGTRVKLALTHEEIGQIIGSSRETVTRTLKDFKSRQLVSLRGSTLVIQNKPALESFATW